MAVQSAIVVIPNYGPLHHLERCLESLSRCSDIDKVAVRVVHSGPSPLQSPLQAPGVRVQTLESTERMFAGAARNRGVSESAEGEVILFIDADCVADPGWISAHLDALGEGALGAAGPILPGPPEAPVGMAEYLIEFAVSRKPPVRGDFMSVPGCNFSIRRDLFERLGGFPNNPTGQDLLFNLRLRAQGERIVFSRAAAVYHCCREQTEAFLANRRRIGRGLGKITRQAEREGLLDAGVNSEYRFLRVICRSPGGVLLLPAKLFRLAVLILRGDFSVLKYALSCPFSLIRGLLLEGRACRLGYLEGDASQ